MKESSKVKTYGKKHIGEEFITNGGYTCKIIDGGSKPRYVTILIDSYITEARYDVVKYGEVKNPYHKSVQGVGFLGEGKFKVSVKGKHTEAYKTWAGMLKRCYNEKSFLKHPTYKDVTVCEEWHNYQNFAEWFEKNYIKNWEIDKDILSLGDKTYSPDVCIFLPKALNSFLASRHSSNMSGFTGVYQNKTYATWTAQINIENKQVYLGSFTNKEDAIKAYSKARALEAYKWKQKMVGTLPNAVIKNIK